MKIGPEAIVFSVVIGLIVLFFVFSQSSNKNEMPSNLPKLGRAPELTGIQEWINSEPLALSELKNKVVLVDFWTYSCINCIRTIPYLKQWHDKYSDDVLVIIGVHTPEFEFEKNFENVRAAVNKYGILYPVVQDNNYATWNAYRNKYWPRKYLIDGSGEIRYDHIGEGAYSETEQAIVQLLNELGKNAKSANTSNPNFSAAGTPELYLGYQFARAPLGNEEGFQPEKIVNYQYVEPSFPNIIYLSGIWENKPDRMISANNSKLFLIYSAKEVNIVAGGNTMINLQLDGKPLGNSSGKDVNQSSVHIQSERLYNIISSQNYGTNLLEISANPGLELYTFTFG